MDLYLRARELRKRMTRAEVILWQQLSKSKLHNYKFRRQAVIEKMYIADFYCFAKKLIIEVDGEIHLQQTIKEKDQIRTENLKILGYNVLRLSNKEVIENTGVVLTRILRCANNI